MTQSKILEDSYRLHKTAVDFVLAMMSSADLEKIGALQWWPRAKAALHVAASTSNSFPEMISVMGTKLHIDILTRKSASVISKVVNEVGSSFEEFRRLCE